MKGMETKNFTEDKNGRKRRWEEQWREELNAEIDDWGEKRLHFE